MRLDGIAPRTQRFYLLHGLKMVQADAFRMSSDNDKQSLAKAFIDQLLAAASVHTAILKDSRHLLEENFKSDVLLAKKISDKTISAFDCKER